MQTLVVVLLGLVAACTAFSESDLEKLAKIDYHVLPTAVKRAIKRSDGTVTNGHWCCANDQPINSIQRSRIKHHMVKVSETVKIGYTECAWLGSGRCSLYDLRYREQPEYYIEHYEVPDEQACADHHVKCCKGFVLIAKDNCLALDEAKEHLDTLKDLLESGLIG